MDGAPCYKCPDRSIKDDVRCHSYCAKYAAFKITYQKIMDAKQIERSKPYFAPDSTARRSISATAHKRTRNNIDDDTRGF